MALVASYQATEVLQPREEAFDLPAPTVPAQLAAVLCEVTAGGAMRCDELNAPLRQARVERVIVIAAVADQAARQAPEKSTLQGVVDERSFGGVCTCDSNGERKTSAVCDRHNLRPLAFAGEADSGAPFFAPAKVASMNASLKS